MDKMAVTGPEWSTHKSAGSESEGQSSLEYLFYNRWISKTRELRVMLPTTWLQN